VGILFEPKLAKSIRSPGTERPKIAYLQAMQKPDQDRRHAVTKRGMPGQGPMNAVFPYARTQRNIGMAVDDWSQEKGQLSWSITVIAVEKNYYVRASCAGQSGQTGATVSATGFAEDAGSH